MPSPLDLDQLQTFCAIADCGSFTEAARRVNKTQSAVSMQIKRLEERLDSPLLVREGRNVSMTSKGEEVYARARRMLRINAEITDLFSNDALTGSIRFGVPDDYAVRILPIVFSQFQKTNPGISVDIQCVSSERLLNGMHSGKFDLIIFTQGTNHEYGEHFRTESIHWVGAKEGSAFTKTPLPMALGPQTCCWRKTATDALANANIEHRVAYTSSYAAAITSAVSSDLAVGVLPASALRPEMKILTSAEGFPKLPDAQIAFMRASTAYGGIYDALVEHIVASLGNLEGTDFLAEGELHSQFALANQAAAE